MWVAFANAKATHIFLAKNISVYAIFNDQSFNGTLTGTFWTGPCILNTWTPQGEWIYLVIFYHFYKGDSFCDFLFVFLYIKPLLKGIYSKSSGWSSPHNVFGPFMHVTNQIKEAALHTAQKKISRLNSIQRIKAGALVLLYIFSVSPWLAW